MKRTLFFSVVLLLLFLAACDTASDDSRLPPSRAVLPELSVGDTWIMHFTLAQEGEEVASGIDTFRVNELHFIGDEPWLDISNTGGFSLSNLHYGNLNTNLYTFRESGIWHRLKDDTEILTIRDPSAAGVEYSIVHGVKGLVKRDTLYSNPDIGTVPVFHYQFRFTSDFRPFQFDGGDLQLVTLNEEVTTSSFFSDELGLVHLEAIGILHQEAETKATLFRRYNWDLIDYIPASEN